MKLQFNWVLWFTFQIETERIENVRKNTDVLHIFFRPPDNTNVFEENAEEKKTMNEAKKALSDESRQLIEKIKELLQKVSFYLHLL